MNKVENIHELKLSQPITALHQLTCHSYATNIL